MVGVHMWRRALTSLVKPESQAEWDGLDFVSRWLIATRSAVTIVTIYSCVIGGLLAWRDHTFAALPWLTVTLGLFVAHGANNLLNDYVDFRRGIDMGDYFRTQYGVHPLVQGFWTERQQLVWFTLSGALAVLAGVLALVYASLAPAVLVLFAFGAAVLLLYTWPLKHLALGELAIFLIWGPIMVAAVYVVLAKGATVGFWPVALAGVPFGLSVVSINIGKHIDKLPEDRKKSVGTLPVRVGEKPARYLNIAVFVLMYLVVGYLVFVSRYFTPVMLVVFLAGRRALYAIGALTTPRPEEPPAGWPAWPTWFSAQAFHHNRLFSNLFVIALSVDVWLRLHLGSFWPPR